MSEFECWDGVVNKATCEDTGDGIVEGIMDGGVVTVETGEGIGVVEGAGAGVDVGVKVGVVTGEGVREDPPDPPEDDPEDWVLVVNAFTSLQLLVVSPLLALTFQ